jgi:NAD(P)H-hydrate epimerase
MIVSYGCREAYVNTTGNDGMAVAGSGDVLSGICAVLMAQMGDCFDAAALAAYIHGSAGDIAASKKTKRALRAIDIIDAISEAMDGKG